MGKDHLEDVGDVLHNQKRVTKKLGSGQFGSLPIAGTSELTSSGRTASTKTVQSTYDLIGRPYNDSYGIVGLTTVIIDFSKFNSLYNVLLVNNTIDVAFENLPLGNSIEFTLDIKNIIASPVINFISGVVNIPTLPTAINARYILHFIGTHDAAGYRYICSDVDIQNAGGGASVPVGITENDHLEWNNSTLLWERKQILEFGVGAGLHAESGFLNFLNNTVGIAWRNSADTGDLQISVDNINVFDFTNSANGTVSLELRAQHATEPDNLMYFTQEAGVTNETYFRAPLIMNFQIGAAVTVFEYDVSKITIHENLRPSGDGTINLGVDSIARFNQIWASAFMFESGNMIQLSTSGMDFNVNNLDYIKFFVNTIPKITMIQSLGSLHGNWELDTGDLTVSGVLTVGSMSITDSGFFIIGDVTPSKKLTFQVDNFAIATTSLIISETLTASRTWTLPDITGTFAMLQGTQTFTGIKTFNENIVAGGAGVGMTNIGHLDFIDNLATPVSSTCIYSDGIDVFIATGGSTVNLSDISDGIFSDATFRIFDNLDASKLLAFEVSGISTLTTRTVTIPNASGTMFYASAVQALTMNTFNISAGGAGVGMTNIGVLTFVDNLATPGDAKTIYSDGIKLLSAGADWDFNIASLANVDALAIVDTAGVSRGSLSGGVSELVMSFASGQKFSIKNVITLIAEFTSTVLDMNAHKISNVLNPTLPQDAVTLDYFNTNGIWLELDGTTTMTGDINVGNFGINNANDINIVRNDGVARAALTGATGVTTQVRLDLVTGVSFFLSEALSDILEYDGVADIFYVHKPFVASATTSLLGGVTLGDASGDSILFVGTVNSAIVYGDGQKQTFNPNATNAGINFGSQAGDPSSLADGDVWYNSTTGKFRAREGGVTVNIIGGGGSQTPWTSDIDAAGWDLLNVGGIQINNPADTFQYIITPSAITADRTMTLPVLLSGDIFTFNSHAATLASKTMDANLNTFTNFGSSEIIAELITGQTEDTTPEVAVDFLLTYDASATSLKKVLLKSLPVIKQLPPPVWGSTLYITPAATTNTMTTATYTQGFLYACPIIITQILTIVAIGFDLTTLGSVSGADAWVCCYSNSTDGTNYPNQLLFRSAAKVNVGSTATLGFQPFSITPSSIVLEPGLYWLAFGLENAGGTSAAISAINGNDFLYPSIVGVTSSDFASGPYWGWNVSFTWSNTTPPTSFPGGGAKQNPTNAPYIVIRASG